MDNWKVSFKEAAEEFIQRWYDEQSGYIRPQAPEVTGAQYFPMIMGLPVGIFVFLNGFVFLLSGFKHFIRFFPDNVVMLVIISISFVVACMLKRKDDEKVRAYNAEKNKLSALESRLDALAQDHPEVPRWWKNIPAYGRITDSASCGGRIMHTGLEESFFFLNRKSTEVISGEQADALLKKTDKFLILTDVNGVQVNKAGQYTIARAEIDSYTNLRALGGKSLQEDDYKLVKRSMYLRMCDERDRQTREIVSFTDDISPKERGETGLSKEALEIRKRREDTESIAKQRLNEAFQNPSPEERIRDAHYDSIHTFSLLGYALYNKDDMSRPIAIALYRNVSDTRYLRLYVNGKIEIADPENPGKIEKKYNYVIGSFEGMMQEKAWRNAVTFFLEEKCGWIDADYSGRPRWGMNLTDWQAFILSHRITHSYHHERI